MHDDARAVINFPNLENPFVLLLSCLNEHHHMLGIGQQPIAPHTPTLSFGQETPDRLPEGGVERHFRLGASRNGGV